ncbi:MAG: 4Fe-4S dicluster domain-containing protein [Thermoguttaceae bacterium]
MSQIISRSALLALADDRINAGVLVAAPVRFGNNKGERIDFAYVTSGRDIVLDSTAMPIGSIKPFFFPRSEVLYTFEQRGSGDVVLNDAALQALPQTPPQLVLAARPCDAAALPLLDHVFAWDFQDVFYQRRREVTTVVTLACSAADADCFCTSVGCSPETTSGADAVLLQIDDDTFEVRCSTDKGRALFAGKTTESSQTGKTATPPPVRFDIAAVQKKLRENYDHPVFAGEATWRCVGCGACTYLCPTCHCFDMVDEGTAASGRKVRNWDTCQFSLFTHHASGHNPRSSHTLRQRQRIQHKMVIYPDKFGVILCTGCGNCRRGCAGTVGVCAVMEKLSSEK